MKIRTKRGTIDDSEIVSMVVLYIGLSTYRISETIDGELSINKTSDGNSDLITIQPKSGNEIALR